MPNLLKILQKASGCLLTALKAFKIPGLGIGYDSPTGPNSQPVPPVLGGTDGNRRLYLTHTTPTFQGPYQHESKLGLDNGRLPERHDPQQLTPLAGSGRQRGYGNSVTPGGDFDVLYRCVTYPGGKDREWPLEFGTPLPDMASWG